jgi:hypothetical protein
VNFYFVCYFVLALTSSTKKTNNTHTHTQIHKETKVVQALHYKEEEEAKKKINNKNQFEI